MNDDLQSARASVAKAEAEILSMLTEKQNRCKMVFVKSRWC